MHRSFAHSPARPLAHSAWRRGTVSIQLLVILVPVLFGIMGFALDLGRIYLIRGELNEAASAAAQAAAAQLIGTSSALDAANTAARLTHDNSTGRGNKYNFGSLVIGDTTGLLSSNAADPSYFTNVSAALADTSMGGGSGDADGTTARHASVVITADAPLLFWSLLSVGQTRKTSIAAKAVAGVSAPLCTACGIEPYAIAAISQDDTDNFGFVPATKYSFGYMCTGAPTPQTLAGTTQRIPYLILNRFDDQSALDEQSQLYRIGAQGLLPSSTPGQACISVSASEQVWASAAPVGCNTNRIPQPVTSTLCGVYSLFDTTAPAACQSVPNVDTLSSSYQPDLDLTDQDDYTAYTGTGRRLITVPIVDALNAGGAMTVLGFRQFLVEPTQGLAANDPGDTNGRFSALYTGVVAPVKQGRFDGGCGITSGPGKVVLHQ
jgi:Flp pilus assembly protein TadG